MTPFIPCEVVRVHDGERLSTIPGDNKYPGMTKLWLDDRYAVVSVGTGPEVEAVLREKAKERRA